MSVYSSPVLYFESATLTDELKPNTYFVKAAIIYPENAQVEVQALQKSLYDTPTVTYAYTDPSTVGDFITQQKMGTHFYVVGQWDDAAQVFAQAIDEGVSEAEIQVKILGDKRKSVYCMKCFTASDIDPQAKAVQCSCGAHLEVGPFYSKVRKGYIGYPFVPEN